MNIITPTADNSNTLFNEAIGENYHSKHGALQESKHVFIDAGLKFATEDQTSISILEVGFGTGLNFILSSAYCAEKNIRLDYTALEPHRLDKELLLDLGYRQYVPDIIWDEFINKYELALSTKTELSTQCYLHIIQDNLQDFKTSAQYDLVYFDAFSVRHQPELWTTDVIEKSCSLIRKGGVFVTYAITGHLKRTVRDAGFEVQKLKGAPGKREMLRAIKL
ncbi:MAG: tRNA (5-methylaminomethyl-2-thiouridylate)-methyltransferase [Sphingobacteriales bacterium]|nr:MAG: tRNA (5-methylaminomethyl-2-thiouridylate)-methyltransferase [Sphingobacteriales bacterium]